MKNNKICEAAEIEFAMKLILNSRLVFSIVALVVGLTVAACSGQPAAPVVATLVPTVTPAPKALSLM
jgi:hypothetical protein